MKTASLMIAIALGIGAASVMKAADEKDAKQQAAEKKVEKSTKAPDEGTPLTGSLIKRDYKRSGQITDRTSQVLLLDREAIERSGASDLKQVLIRRGIH